MAKVHTVEKSRKECKCGKCGKTIPVGSKYVWGQRFKAPNKTIRCTDCGLESYELSGSEWVQSIGAMTNDFGTTYGYSEDGIADAISTLEELRDNSQDSYDNLPENFQYGEQGELLENRVEQCDEAIDSLESIDIDECKTTAIESVGTYTMSKKNYVEAFGEFGEEDVDELKDDDDVEIDLTNYEYDDLISYIPDIESNLEEALEEAISSEVEDAIANLEY